MITKITGEQPFQVLTSNFSISPSQEGYTLQISADGRQYSNLFTVGAGVTRLVTGVAANSYYRLSGNQSQVSVNWLKTCVTEGGGGASGTELSPVSEFPLGAEAGTVVAYNGTASASGVYQYTGEEWVAVGVDDLSAYWTSAQTQSAITAVEDHLFDVEEVTASALTELHEGLLEVSARTIPDMSLYTPTSGFSTINGSAITNGGNIVIEGGDSTVLKGVSEFPEDAEVGDMVSKISEISEIIVGDFWNFDDETTARLHFDENNLDTGETYTIAEFTAYGNGQLGTFQVKYEYGDFNSAGQNNWYLRVFWPNHPDITNIKLDGLNQQDLYYFGPKAEDSSQTIAVDVRYAQDDFSGSGWMIQIGVADGQYGWGGTYEDITDLETYDIEIPSGTKADGPYYYDGEDWVNIKEDIKEEAGKVAEDKVLGAFPRMPFFSLGGVDIDQVKSAIFDVNGDGDPISSIWLFDTAFDWLDNNVYWEDGQINFIIDPDEKVAYVENIPAGNYIFGLHKEQAGDNYDPEFDINYWSKYSNNWEVYTVENSTIDIWDNSDLAIDDYWRYKFEGDVVLSNNGEWFNWSFPKDVKRFEIRIVDDGQGNESLEINTTYDDSLEVLDEVVSAALVDLNEKKVESQDVKHIVKLTQAEYDLIANPDPETFYIIVNNN